MTTPKLALIVPCYNEAGAIAEVVAECRAALPDVEIVVFDNNSTDATAALAEGAGARVVPIAEQGKGHVVRAGLAMFADWDAVAMIDGDGTYPASFLLPLIELVVSKEADMAVMARRPVAAPGSMSPIRGLGNVLIRAAFRACVGRGSDDPLSGGRVVGPKYLAEAAPLLTAEGFEIEVQLEAAAVRRKLRIVSLPGDYRPRAKGTVSKLRPFHDGWRILKAILRQSRIARLSSGGARRSTEMVTPPRARAWPSRPDRVARKRSVAF